MDQMPSPMAPAPPISQKTRARPRAAVTRPARSSAVYDAQIAMRTESATSRKSYEPVSSGVPVSKNYPLGAIRLAAPRDCLILVLLIAESNADDGPALPTH